jgi:hypothetical protein
MSTVAELQTAVKRLPAADRVALFQWLSRDRAVRARELAALRAAVDEGIRDHEEGRFIEIRTPAEHRAFFDDIKRRGRARLKKSA